MIKSAVFLWQFFTCLCQDRQSTIELAGGKLTHDLSVSSDVAKYCSGCFGLQLSLHYDIPTYSVKHSVKMVIKAWLYFVTYDILTAGAVSVLRTALGPPQCNGQVGM